ncbi:GAF domain-containing protein [Pontiella agarivorans]|uniref:GAF domain-containing protein n=1 Tax=Pontiella agarivorans TaxID=3038953 RepID=A0ABU5N0V4_9BACT|nr:GAF domain-containing protein [Pontiella agarivorans]MDZ8119876.1 GAF domain-containing protein [Pontiella agarivorans]
MPYPRPKNEVERLQALKNYAVLDTPPEQELDDLTQLASYICDAPIALISLVDETRQWFKAKVGIEAPETPRDIAFCTHAILQSELFVVPDALDDDRFIHNPLVTTDPKIRFYAGAQLVTPAGHSLGTLCVIDRKPRELSRSQVDALKTLANQVIAHLELRHLTYRLERTNQEQANLITKLQQAARHINMLEDIIPICSSCKKIHNGKGDWQPMEDYISAHSDTRFSHGICPECAKKIYPDYCEPKAP